jgi:hypothetical protein
VAHVGGGGSVGDLGIHESSIARANCEEVHAGLSATEITLA